MPAERAPAARRQPLLAGGAQQQQQLALLAPQESYQSSRAVALQNVERTIHELGAIFQDLAVMARAPRQAPAACSVQVCSSLRSALVSLGSWWLASGSAPR